MTSPNINNASMYKSINIDEVLDGFPQVQSDFTLAKYAPINFVAKDVVESEVDVSLYGGMMPLSARGANAALYEPDRGRGKVFMQTPVWKEKIRVGYDELYDNRTLGTFATPETMAEKRRFKMVHLMQRLARRMEYMRREAIFNQQVIAYNKQGQLLRFAFTGHHADMRPTATTSWDDPTADPVNDMQLWAEHFLKHSTYEMGEIRVPHTMLSRLTQLNKFTNLQQNNFASFDGSESAVTEYFSRFVPAISIGSIVEDWSRITAASKVGTDAALGATSLVVDNLHNIEVGTSIEVYEQSTRERHIYKVDGITEATKTLSLATPLARDTKVGDVVNWKVYTVPADRLLILGRTHAAKETAFNQNAVGRVNPDDFMEIVSTIHRDNDIKQNTLGLWTKTIDNTQNTEISSIEDVLGINGMIRILNGTGWMVPTVLF